MISRRARVVSATHTTPAELRVTTCATHHLPLKVETLPAETYMYLLGLSSKSLAYLACLPCVPFRYHSLAGDLSNYRLLEQGGSMLHAAAWLWRRESRGWVCTTSLFACVVHECVRITACMRLASLASFGADGRKVCHLWPCHRLQYIKTYRCR